MAQPSSGYLLCVLVLPGLISLFGCGAGDPPPYETRLIGVADGWQETLDRQNPGARTLGAIDLDVFDPSPNAIVITWSQKHDGLEGFTLLPFKSTVTVQEIGPDGEPSGFLHETDPERTGSRIFHPEAWRGKYALDRISIGYQLVEEPGGVALVAVSRSGHEGRSHTTESVPVPLPPPFREAGLAGIVTSADAWTLPIDEEGKPTWPVLWEGTLTVNGSSGDVSMDVRMEIDAIEQPSNSTEE